MKDSSNVVVDIGNTNIKFGIFRENKLLSQNDAANLDALRNQIPQGPHRWIFSSVRNNQVEISKIFDTEDYLILSKETHLPISLDYKTPETLGMDRIAAAVGANLLYPERHNMIIDAGTCITYDLVDNQRRYQGGAIAPGLMMRMKAMASFTSRLPDITSLWQNTDLGVFGKSTVESMINGTFQAILHEMNGFIEAYSKEYGPINVIMTGGDAKHFESKLKAPIFADFNLVLIGLNGILNHNK